MAADTALRFNRFDRRCTTLCGGVWSEVQRAADVMCDCCNRVGGMSL